MTTFSKQLKLSTAVFAAAAVLITPSIAFADTEGESGSDTESASVGTSAAKTPKRAGRGANKPSTTSSGSSATASSPAADSSPAPAEEVADAPEIPEVGAVEGPSADATADATAFDNPLFQNPLIWIGTPNPAPPTPIVEFETFPLEDVSEPLRGAFGWMEGFEFEACVLGLSSVTRGQTVMGPYGTATSSICGGGCA